MSIDSQDNVNFCAAGWNTDVPCKNKRGFTQLHYCVSRFEHIGRHSCSCGRGRANVSGDKEVVTNL